MAAAEKYTDQTIMPFGKYKTKTLANVPDEYLLYLYKQGLDNQPKLKQYVEDNLASIKKNANIKEVMFRSNG